MCWSLVITITNVFKILLFHFQKRFSTQATKVATHLESGVNSYQEGLVHHILQPWELLTVFPVWFLLNLDELLLKILHRIFGIEKGAPKERAPPMSLAPGTKSSVAPTTLLLVSKVWPSWMAHGLSLTFPRLPFTWSFAAFAALPILDSKSNDAIWMIWLGTIDVYLPFAISRMSCQAKSPSAYLLLKPRWLTRLFVEILHKKSNHFP